MIATLFYNPKILSGEFLWHPLISGLLLFFCWTFISVIFSSEQLMSVKYLLAKSWYILSFVFIPLIFFRDKLSIRKAGLFFIFSMSCAVVLMLTRHAGVGFRFSTVNAALSPFFRNHVNYSAMLVCSIPILFACYSLSGSSKRTIWLILIAIFLFALYFSYSRGAWLALGTGITAYWLVKKKLLVSSFFISILVIISAFVWLRSNDNYLRFAPNYNKTIFHQDFEQHIRATYQLKDISTAERFYRWVAGVKMIKENALTGFGPNSFNYHYKENTLPSFKTWVSGNQERSTVHNYFLLLAIEQGIPGLVLFLILIGVLLYYVQYLYHRIQDLFYRTIAITAGAILTMILTLNFLSDLIETDKIGSLFFLCISLLIVADVKTRGESESSPDIQRIS
jgi:O-antigen ligase